MSPLVIVLIVVVVMLVLGGGGCLLCVGLAASIGASADAIEGGAAPVSTSPAGLVHDAFARDLEKRLRQQGVPATQVLCPEQQSGSTFECELTVGSDRAQVQVKKGAAGFEFEVPNTAFLEGAKLASSFATSIASKIDPKLRVPCFTGTLMKKVGSQFTCEVVSGTAAAGSLAVTVEDVKGNVRMELHDDEDDGTAGIAAGHACFAAQGRATRRRLRLPAGSGAGRRGARRMRLRQPDPRHGLRRPRQLPRRHRDAARLPLRLRLSRPTAPASAVDLSSAGCEYRAS